jgi:hypothetical protein
VGAFKIGIWLGSGFWRIIHGVLRGVLVGERSEEDRQGKGNYRRRLIADYEAGVIRVVCMRVVVIRERRSGLD